MSWTWAAASRRGTSHARAGERRQDAFLVRAAGGSLVAVACDGAGSSSHGGAGAAVVARTVAAAAQRWCALGTGVPCDDVVVGWVVRSRLRLAGAADRLGIDVRGFATTLVMVVADADGAVVAHVGDGAAVGRSAASGEWSALSWPESGEYASTTFFVTDDDIRLRVSRYVGRWDRLAVMTDGIERLALDFGGRVPHAPLLEGLTGPVARSAARGHDFVLSRRLGDYLDSPNVCERTDDDKTVIVAALS